MRLVSVNIGQEQALSHAKASGKTGIYKRHISTPVPVTAAGLQGDVICDTKNHGGVDQAVYVYGVPDYQWWSQELGHDVAPGTFGENLTVTDLESAEVSIGDRLRIGPVVLEVTAPRIPCVTLARRMDDPAFLKRFRAAERPGVYCRVLREGTGGGRGGLRALCGRVAHRARSLPRLLRAPAGCGHAPAAVGGPDRYPRSCGEGTAVARVAGFRRGSAVDVAEAGQRVVAPSLYTLGTVVVIPGPVAYV